MYISVEESKASNFTVSNPASLLREMYHIDRISLNKETGLYEHKNSQFNGFINTNSRLYAQSYVSSSIFIFDYFSGIQTDNGHTLDDLMRTIKQATERSNSACLLIPTSTIKRKAESRTLDKESNDILKKHFPMRAKRDSLEFGYKPILPVYLFYGSKFPYKDQILECTE